MGQRLASSLIALLCASVFVVLLQGTVLTTWTGVALSILALFGTFVFGHVTVRGTLPGHFKSGGNAFVGARRNIDVAGAAFRTAPIAQRVICGVLATAGGVAILARLMTGLDVESLNGVVDLALSIGGCYLFAHIALYGRLPRARLGGGNAAVNHRRRRRDG